ncbi:M28 family peptidase [Streptomyces sp. DSM 44915]|uniref:M28 family peptidase n=1 Tax=Streptomyces chisholmiae TaxID=3075540 RepID=A0ABU2JQE9_9ACTN|nr:M28 family peptidase [Streptomyces sp. DSM 44915]MDT0267209.1 M28 family peptidase [Streptomyces sp. DSM 44915]
MIALVATALTLALATPFAPPSPLPSATPAVAAGTAAASAAGTAAASAAGTAAEPTPAQARGAELAGRMVAGLTDTDALHHLGVFQEIADAEDGHRAAGSAGHERSARYAGRVLADAGYQVTYEHFTFPYREPVAERLTVLGDPEREIEVHALSYTGNTEPGGLTAPLVEIRAHGDGGAGCAAEDFAGRDVTGHVALLARGDCTFAQKQANAAAAGAAAVLVYNSEPGRLSGTLGEPDPAALPTGGLAQADGLELAAAARAADTPLTVRLDLRELVEDRETVNVLAETRGGDPSQVVLVGAHLDSVAAGPGINDNASGAAGVLATAQALAQAAPAGGHPHRVRFALWSAEEHGLRGAEHHVAELSPADRAAVALYLNYDMIGSPNHGLFVYDGADRDPRSAAISADLTAFLGGSAATARPTPFDDRSDYAPFLAAGIPAGGTFAGGDGLKSDEEAALWGGTAGEPYDPCYHRDCDTLENIDPAGLATHTAAIAQAVGRYAWALPAPVDQP